MKRIDKFQLLQEIPLLANDALRGVRKEYLGAFQNNGEYLSNRMYLSQFFKVDILSYQQNRVQYFIPSS